MSPTCILVVDSDRTYQDHLGKKLKSLGFSVQSASGAGEVLARLDEHAPDVVLIDEMVKDLTPGRLLEEIQNRDLDAFTIVMAKDANLDRGMRWVVSGAFACLSKPLEMPDLLRAIAKGLENKDAFHRVVSMAQELTATNHALLEEKASLNEKTEELRFLYHLASQLSATLDPRQIAGIIGRALSKLIGA
ncbi:MAG: response regulator, partial [Pseudomonadota bacterium]